MPSTAISAQGSTVQINTGTGGALNVTAVALGNPARVTLSAVTGLNKGDVVAFAGVVGTTQLNGNSYTIQYIDTVSRIVTLANTDASAWSAWVSGGTATPIALTKISNVKTFQGLDSTNTELDTTNLDSSTKELLMGLLDPGQFTIEVDQDNSDPGQLAVLTAQAGGALKTLKLTLPNGNTATFPVRVKKTATTGGVDQILKRSIEFSITGVIVWA